MLLAPAAAESAETTTTEPSSATETATAVETAEAAMPAARAADAGVATTDAARGPVHVVGPVAIAPGLLLAVESSRRFSATAEASLVPSAATVLLPTSVGAALVCAAVLAGESVVGLR